MTSPNGPICDYCHKLLPGGCGYARFHFTERRYCTLRCADADEAEQLREARAGYFTIGRYGTRHWAVYDGNDELVCVTLYRKGAKEVIRRLSA